MPLPQHQLAIDYQEALQVLQAVAECQWRQLKLKNRMEAIQLQEPGELQSVNDKHAANIPLAQDIGRICTEAIIAPFDIPGSDTSAMDGYAVCSSLTKDASPLRPTKFKVVGSIAAGESQICAKNRQEIVDERLPPCFEIMTGASFPTDYPQLDSVVKVEDVQNNDSTVHWSKTARAHYIEVTAPVRSRQHRRPVGSDYQAGDVVLRPGERIERRHVMALASLGLTTLAKCTRPDISATQPSHQAYVSNQPRLRVVVLSTGSEVIDPRKNRNHSLPRSSDGQSLLFDSNGPYLCNELHRIDQLDVSYCGVVGDREVDLVGHIESAGLGAADVLILTGGVSKGRHDLTRACVEEALRGKVHFHGVKIRPGAPILFSTVNMKSPSQQEGNKEMVVFGIPGNPMAVAAGFQFFIKPYFDFFLGTGDWYRMLATQPSSPLGNRSEMEIAEVRTPEGFPKSKPRGIVAFWLAWKEASGVAEGVAEICVDQASYKTSVLTKSNCWVVVPADLDCVMSGLRLVTIAH
jgi:molybdopterin molybdotransferase